MSQISFVLTYVVALPIRIPKWAHLSSNSKRLVFGGRWCEGWFWAKLHIYIGKWPKIITQFSHKSPKMWRLGRLGMPVLISGLGFRVIQKVYAAILKILIFWWFLASRRSKFDQKLEKSQNFDLRPARNHRKSKFSKSPHKLFVSP